MRGFERPSQPIMASARATLFGCCLAAASGVGAGLLKKSSGSWERTVSMLKSSGSRRLNSYGKNGSLVHNASYRSRNAWRLARALVRDNRSNESAEWLMMPSRQ